MSMSTLDVQPTPLHASKEVNPEMDAAEIHAPLLFDKRLPLCRTSTRYYMISPAGSAEVLEARAKGAKRVACKLCKRILNPLTK